MKITNYDDVTSYADGRVSSDAHPYTPEQVTQFANAAKRYGSSANDLLAWLHEAGITVTFPEPRYYLESNPSRTFWHVLDRQARSRIVAVFHPDHPDAESAARREAERLNEGVTA